MGSLMNKTKPQGSFGTVSGAPRDDAPRSRAPRSLRTPALGGGASAGRGPAADESAEWIKQARRLIASLEESIAQHSSDPRRVAAVERAAAAYDLGGVSEATVSRVAHLVDRVYVAMQEAPRPHSDKSLQGCAHILYNGLPRSVRGATNFAAVLELVRRLEEEPQLWPAVVKGTSELLGWSGLAANVAGRAIRVAMATDPPK